MPRAAFRLIFDSFSLCKDFASVTPHPARFCRNTSSHHLLKIGLGLATSLFLCACLEQYDPSSSRKLFEKERKIAARVTLELTEKGEIPIADKAATETVSVVETQYQSYCASCHGAQGKADSAVAQAMNPKPRSFQDPSWQASVDDAHIAKVIKEGGMAVGLSSTMAPWGAVMSDEEINNMVAKIRAFAADTSP